MRPSARRVLDGDADFDARLLPRLCALPYFREATGAEIDASFAAYASGDFERLCEVWREVADPVRATLPPKVARAYGRAHLAPRRVSAYAFLSSLRAVLAAGVRFRATLRPELARALETGFPWLEHRHEHVPPGFTPRFDFPPVFAAFIEAADLDDARARWQLAAALNEVQQSAYSLHAAARFRLPELTRHAARERALAVSYFSHWAPEVTRELWRQCVLSLDGLNAAVFALLCEERPGEMIARSLVGALTSGGEWRAFRAGLDVPQWLLPVAR